MHTLRTWRALISLDWGSACSPVPPCHCRQILLTYRLPAPKSFARPSGLALSSTGSPRICSRASKRNLVHLTPGRMLSPMCRPKESKRNWMIFTPTRYAFIK